MRGFFALICLCFAMGAHAKPLEARAPDFVGLVDIGQNQTLFAKVWYGNKDLPPNILINGLTQDSAHWQRALPVLLQSGATVVSYDALLQGRSLMDWIRRERVLTRMGTRPLVKPLLARKNFWANRDPLLPPVSDAEQVDALRRLLHALGLKQKVTLQGLSYGGGIALLYGATYPNDIQDLILAAPYVAPEPKQDQMIKTSVRNYKLAFPFQTYSDDEIYDYFLQKLILTSYHFSEPTILKWGLFQPYGASQLIMGIRHLDSHALVKKLPPRSLHLVVAGEDAYIPQETLRDFWQAAPEEVRGSLLTIRGVEHKINESVGPFLSGWANLVMKQDKNLNKGLEFKGRPEEGYAEAIEGGLRLELPKTDICEHHLLQPRNGSVNLPVDRIIRRP